MRKRRKGNLTKLKNKLMEMVKAYVKERDSSQCQWCGKQVEGSNCHVSHVIPVSQGNALAFEPLNMKILCYHCHLNRWHKKPLEASEWFKNKFPDRYAFLEEHKNDEVHWKEFDYEEMIEEWEKTKEPSEDGSLVKVREVQPHYTPWEELSYDQRHDFATSHGLPTSGPWQRTAEREYQRIKPTVEPKSIVIGYEPVNENSPLSRSYEHIKVQPILDSIQVEPTVDKWERDFLDEMCDKVGKLYYWRNWFKGNPNLLPTPLEVLQKYIIPLSHSVQEAKAGIEFKALQDFMGFVRNGHNLKPGDLDRIEGEYALFMSRYYLEFTDKYLASLKQEEETCTKMT